MEPDHCDFVGPSGHTYREDFESEWADAVGEAIASVLQSSGSDHMVVLQRAGADADSSIFIARRAADLLATVLVRQGDGISDDWLDGLLADRVSVWAGWQP